MPSNNPAADPGPPACHGQRSASVGYGMLPLMNVSMHAVTNLAREAGVAATSEK
jgi:hypothetical protein